MIAFFRLLVIVAIVLGIAGVAAKGLLYLLFIPALPCFLAALPSPPCACGGGLGGAGPLSSPSHLTRDFLGGCNQASREGSAAARRGSGRSRCAAGGSTAGQREITVPGDLNRSPISSVARPNRG